MEPGESPGEALKREISEELGLSVKVLGLIGVYYKIYESNLTLAFSCEVESGRPAPDEKEIEEFCFFPPSDFPATLSNRQKCILSDAVEGTVGMVRTFDSEIAAGS